jgi:hypothetical protein
VTIADSAALRTRRARAHKAGDHSLCKRCPEVRIDPQEQEVPADDAGKLRWLAAALAQAYKAEPGNALLARELRMTLQALMGGRSAGSQDAELEELFAELGGA